MKIGFKLTLTMVVLSLLVLGSVGITMLVQARNYIIRFSHESALSVANEYAEAFGGFFSSYWYLAQTTARVVEQYHNIDINARRFFLNRTFEGLLASNPGVSAIWSLWEPDAVDGNDILHIGTEGTNATGRFAPYWYRAAGEIRVRALDAEILAQQDDYYRMAMRTSPGAIRDPFSVFWGGTGELASTITATIYSGGQIVGIVGVDFSLNPVQQTASTLFPLNDGVTKVFSNNGTVVGHRLYPYRIGTSILDTERDMGGPYMDELEMAVREGKTLYYQHFHPGFQAWMNMFIAPIQIGSTDTPWSLALVIPRSSVMAAVYMIERTALIISLVVLALIIPLVLFMSRSLTSPILKVADTLKDISEGEGDLTKQLIITSKDEIGSLAHYFNLTLAKIKNLVLIIKKEASTLSEIGNDLSSNMVETAAAMNQIAANLQSIQSRVLSQSDSARHTHVAMEQVVGNINKLNGYVEDQSASISKSSSAIEQMVANTQSVTETLIKNTINIKTLREASEVGRSGLQDVAADIQEIARESEGLMEINSVMENIASQTNLLSMNAAIEAAHAGEAGRGFAVVADEIRKLAENSGEQSKIINTVLKKITGSISKITNSTENVLSNFEAIDSSVKTVTEQEETLRYSMEEQGQGSRQILDGMSAVNEITQHVNIGSSEMLAGAKEVIQESTNLGKVTAEITSGVSEMASGAEQVNVAVHHVSEISDKTREGIDKLMREVSRFKVD